jgi:hypothetical protein
MHDNEQSVTAADAPTQAVDGTVNMSLQGKCKIMLETGLANQCNSFG